MFLACMCHVEPQFMSIKYSKCSILPLDTVFLLTFLIAKPLHENFVFSF